MTGPLKRLGVVVSIVIRKFLKFIDPERFLVSFTHSHPPPGHTPVNKAQFSVMRATFNSLGLFRRKNGGGAKGGSH